ncbi:hypothetical protein GWK36_01685 [Caldichromatium japonicum]|uniref:PilZ domain-containing protein n=1 Tax=Caldichromatium japonicum TaxID=2699430 RepID=A0A6G7VAD8_9GAMM|nr:hypothetical protein [Caldichromatium japonicum]QIK36922.1 hypothetical protein GWK36_01685 [Caldichromatium japonicum]
MPIFMTCIQVGEHLVVRFPWVSGQTLTIEAEVLRSQGLDTGRWQIGLRFIHSVAHP